MATRAKIGLMQKNELVKSVYHHWDGYPSWLGSILSKNYTDEDSINALLDGGDISSISSNKDWDNQDVSPNIVLYYRDRGEDCDPIVEEYSDFLNCRRGEDYIYLFKDGEWTCRLV